MTAELNLVTEVETAAVRPDTPTNVRKLYQANYDRVFIVTDESGGTKTNSVPCVCVLCADGFTEALWTVKNYEEGRIVGGMEVSTIEMRAIQLIDKLPPFIG